MKWKQRIGLGSIEFGRNVTDFLITSYLTVYLTTIAKVPLAAVSLMFIVCKIIDACTDYLVGNFCDKTRTKIGRSRPYMLVGVFVLALGLLLLFNNRSGSVAYTYVTYILYTLGMTLVVIPEGALIPALSTDSKERTNLAAVRGLCGGFGQLLATNMIAAVVVGENLSVYFKAAGLCAVITAVLVLIGLFLISEVNLPPIEKKAEMKDNFVDLKYLFTDKNYLLMCAYAVFMMMALIPIFSELVFYYKDVMHNMMFVALSFSILSLMNPLGSVICPIVNRFLSKKNTAIFGEALWILAYIVLFIGRGNPYMALAGIIIWGVGNGFTGTMMWAMQPEIFDLIEYKTGRSMVALPTAIISYACKLGNAIGSSLAVAVMAWLGYNPAAEAQTASGQNGVLMGFIGIPLIATVLMLIVTNFFDMDKKYAEAREELDRRHAEKGHKDH